MGRPRIDKDQSEANKKYIGIEIETLENTSKKTEKDRNCYVKSWLKWLKCPICLQWFNETYFNLQNLSITDRNWCRLNMKQIWRLKKMIYSKCCISIGSEEKCVYHQQLACGVSWFCLNVTCITYFCRTVGVIFVSVIRCYAIYESKIYS